MSDKYQKAVEYLTANPREIWVAWDRPDLHPAGCLFQFVTPSGKKERLEATGKTCGCLTMVKADGFEAWTPELTKAIRADERLPYCSLSVAPHHLPVFAEWQARIDRELRCKNPTL